MRSLWESRSSSSSLRSQSAGPRPFSKPQSPRSWMKTEGSEQRGLPTKEIINQLRGAEESSSGSDESSPQNRSDGTCDSGQDCQTSVEKTCQDVFTASSVRWRNERHLVRSALRALPKGMHKDKPGSQSLPLPKPDQSTNVKQNEVPDVISEVDQSEQSTSSGTESPEQPKPHDTSLSETIMEDAESLDSRSLGEKVMEDAESVDIAPENTDELDDDDKSDDIDPILARPAKPCEDGMSRYHTFLYAIEQNELYKELRVIVPMDIRPDRLAYLSFENKRHTVQFPPGIEPGQEVPFAFKKRPPLERSPHQAWCRGHYNFPDRSSIVETLRRGSRTEAEHCSMGSQEFMHRQELYQRLRGSAMNPLLPFTPEEEGVVDD